MSARERRYRTLLALRVQLGEQLIDQLCHSRYEGANELNRQCLLIEGQLEHHAAFPEDFSLVVLGAEQARFHVPGKTLAPNDDQRPCRWCRRSYSALPASIALPCWGAA